MTLNRPNVVRGGLAALAATVVIWSLLAPRAWEALAVALVLLGCFCAMVLVAQRGPALTLSIGLGLMVFSGNWTYMGSPIPLDRVVMAIGIGALIMREDTRKVIVERLRHPIGILLCVVAAYALLSSARSGTLHDPDAFYGLLDSLGIFPFALWLAAPAAFATRRDRDLLLGTLVVLGAYLGLTALFETIHLTALVFPKYINNPEIGIHYGRARGPFVEASANGLALFSCAVASAIALHQWRGQRRAAGAGFVLVLCAAGILFTLTRAVWIGSLLATLATLALFPQLRRYLIPSVLAVAAVTAVALFTVPGLSQSASERESDQSPIWDRLNTDAAAVRMLEARPLTGFGWHTFEEEGPAFMRQAGGYPLTGAGLNVHNVFLAHLAELGLIGTLLWAAALISVFWVGAIRAGPPWMLDWRMGFVAIGLCWLFVANFVPLTYALPNSMLWMWAGLASLRQPEPI